MSCSSNFLFIATYDFRLWIHYVYLFITLYVLIVVYIWFLDNIQLSRAYECVCVKIKFYKLVWSYNNSIKVKDLARRAVPLWIKQYFEYPFGLEWSRGVSSGFWICICVEWVVMGVVSDSWMIQVVLSGIWICFCEGIKLLYKCPHHIRKLGEICNFFGFIKGKQTVDWCVYK